MHTDIPIRCHCGKLEGTARDVSARSGNHVICHCDDCQLFQHFLGRAERVLDDYGGTEIFQMSPGKVRITSGKQHLACLRLRPGGLVRWYADCCNTPIGNTLATPRVPFVGLVTACLHDSENSRELDRALGPIRCGVHGRYAYGHRDDVKVHDKAPLSLIGRFVGKMLGWRLRGDHKRSPFFDPATGRPCVEPMVLSNAELESLLQQREALASSDD